VLAVRSRLTNLNLITQTRFDALKTGILLSDDWKYKAGDNPEWANSDFDDSSWEMFNDANLYNKEIQKKVKKANIIWYRVRIFIDSTTTQKLVINLFQWGASEIYLDGELIHSLGKVSSNTDSLICINQSPFPLSFPMKIGKEQVLAVRFAVNKSKLPVLHRSIGFLTIRVQTEDYANKHLFVATASLFNKDGILDLGNREGWRFHPGDDLNWAKPDFDDKNWIIYRPSSLTEPIPDSLWNRYGWFRYRFAADSTVYAKVTNLFFWTYGAAEVYLDSKLIQKYGVFSTDPQFEKRYNEYLKIFPSMVLQQSESHVLAVRYSYHKGQQYKKLLGKYAGSFGFGIGLATDSLNQPIITQMNQAWQLVYILGTMLLLIILLHGFLFALFPTDRSNLYIVIMASLSILTLIGFNANLLFEPDVLLSTLIAIPLNFLIFAVLAMIPFTINSMFNQRSRLRHKILIWLIPVFALVNFILSGFVMNNYIIVIISIISVFYSSQVIIQAWKNKQQGVWFVATAFLSLVISAVAFFIYSSLYPFSWDEYGKILIYIAYASLPLGLTAFMASRFKDLYTNLEQKVNERTRALNQSMEDLRSTQTQLIQTEKMASLGQLTAGIAHEIQNPLNFVNNFSEVNTELIDEMQQEMDKGNLDEAKAISNDIKENEQKINHHGKRAESIVKGMLLHSRGSSGHKEPTDINALCDEFLRLSYHGFRANDKTFNAEYKTEFDPNLPKINVVPQDIGRVLLNLINNAFYAVSEQNKLFQSSELWKSYQPLVAVSTIKLDHRIQITVKDNGPGIPPEIKDKIFQPFFTTKPTGQGTGLGLSLAYDIVKAHGGEIKVQSAENEGTELIVNLPV
jgi:signal transduction histidine kinase